MNTLGECRVEGFRLDAKYWYGCGCMLISLSSLLAGLEKEEGREPPLYTLRGDSLELQTA